MSKSRVIRGSIFRHLRTGDCYRVIDRAVLEWNTEEAVVYTPCSAAGTVWVRTLDEFEERFEHIEAPNVDWRIDHEEWYVRVCANTGAWADTPDNEEAKVDRDKKKD